MIVALLFGCLFLLIALGLPIALSIGLPAIGFMLLPGVFPAGVPLSALGQTIIQLLFAGVDSFDLLDIPLFMLAGSIMETGGISRRLVALATALVGHIRGGLGIAVVLSEVLFSGISGSSGADASAIGSILIPPMVRAGYPPERTAAIVAAASGMGILIPPCLVMVVLGAMSGLSISALFIAGFLPGFLMALTLIGVIYAQRRRGGTS